MGDQTLDYSHSSWSKATSALTESERQQISEYLNDRPWFDFYYQCSLDDLSNGVDNRMYRTSATSDGLVMGIDFGEVAVLTYLGDLEEADWSPTLYCPKRMELHVESDIFEELKQRCASRLRRTDTIRLYSKPLVATESISAERRTPTENDAEELQDFFSMHHPETVYSPQMISQPHSLVTVDGKLVSVAGTLVSNSRLGVALLGNFVTAKDHRGKGYAAMAANHVFQQLQDDGFSEARLGVFGSNPSAIKLYERLGFTLVHELNLIYVDAA